MRITHFLFFSSHTSCLRLPAAPIWAWLASSICPSPLHKLHTLPYRTSHPVSSGYSATVCSCSSVVISVDLRDAIGNRLFLTGGFCQCPDGVFFDVGSHCSEVFLIYFVAYYSNLFLFYLGIYTPSIRSLTVSFANLGTHFYPLFRPVGHTFEAKKVQSAISTTRYLSFWLIGRRWIQHMYSHPIVCVSKVFYPRAGVSSLFVSSLHIEIHRCIL